MEENTRVKGFECDDIFINRWSARALSKEGISKDTLMVLFEAAKWAPSSYNEQPWRIIYALNGAKGWEEIFGSLVEFNQSWAKNAGALIVMCSNKFFAINQKVNRHNSFDAGSAWMSMALQASKMGLYTHGMAGFDANKIRLAFNVPESVEVLAVIAVGSYGKKEMLPEDIRIKEAPNQRRNVEDFAFEGEFIEN